MDKRRHQGAATGELSSPACSMGEADPAYMGAGAGRDGTAPADLAAWRRSERARLLAARAGLGAEVRRDGSERIAAALDEALGEVAGRLIGGYWPVRGEPDLRPWMERVCARGGACALPVVTAPGEPMVFRPWRPGVRLERGFGGIPVPAEGPDVAPEVLIAPLVGFDRAGYRLGYGGGYFDRTLAALSRRPRVVGVGYRLGALRSIYPQRHDVAMDLVITEDGVVAPESEGERAPSGGG
jgi:5-formyltetrahydrofolate cyclo-ligase